MNKDTYRIEDFFVRSYECGADKNIHFSNICNYMQEIASIHAEELGFSMKNFSDDNLTWVMTRMKIRIDEYPKWGDTVRILTFPYGLKKLVAFRDFEIFVDDKRIGRASTEWMVINIDTRKLAPIPSIVSEYSNNVREPVFGDTSFAKISFPKENILELYTDSYKVRRTHIDPNGHVNNVRYIEWIINTLPTDTKLKEIEITFKSETLLGETIYTKCAKVENKHYVCAVSDEKDQPHVILNAVVE